MTSWGVPLCGGLGKGLTDGDLQRQDLGSGVEMWGFLKLFLKAPLAELASCSAMEKVLITGFQKPHPVLWRFEFFFFFHLGSFSTLKIHQIFAVIRHTPNHPSAGTETFSWLFFRRKCKESVAFIFSSKTEVLTGLCG